MVLGVFPASFGLELCHVLCQTNCQLCFAIVSTPRACPANVKKNVILKIILLKCKHTIIFLFDFIFYFYIVFIYSAYHNLVNMDRVIIQTVPAFHGEVHARIMGRGAHWTLQTY